MNRLLSLLLAALLLLALPVSASASGQASLDLSDHLASAAARSGAESVEDWITVSLPARLSAGSGEWELIALRGAGYAARDLKPCTDALRDYLSGASGVAAVSEQKYALALLFGGISDDPFLHRVLAENSEKQGIMSQIWGIILAKAAGSIPDEAAVGDLLALQGQDGGFALTPSAPANPDVTAMAIQALSLCEGTGDAISEALACLLSLRTESGHYISYGVENAESIAQVILALIAARADRALIDEHLSVLLTFETKDGFAHVQSGPTVPMACSQALLALCAYDRMDKGLPFLFDLSGYEEHEETGSLAPESIGTTAVPETDAETDAETDSGPSISSSLQIRFLLAAALLGIALVILIVLLLRRRARGINLICLLLATALLLVLILLLPIETPEDYYGTPETAGETGITVSITIRFSEEVEGGRVLAERASLSLPEGETVFGALLALCKSEHLTVDITGSSALPETVYVRGIGGVYEFDHGPLSGWTYTVNGTSPSLGCGSVPLSDGDRIEWILVTDITSPFSTSP